MKSGVISVTVAGAILCSMTALADDSPPYAPVVSQNTKFYVRDSAITTKVKIRLAAEHVTSLAQIHVDTDANRIVHLSGTAPSREAIDTAIRLARETENVLAVRCDITLN